MSKRIVLLEDISSEQLMDTTIEAADELAAKYIREGRAELAAQQIIYNHQSEMPPEVRAQAKLELARANAAGGPRDQVARANANRLPVIDLEAEPVHRGPGRPRKVEAQPEAQV
jgi:hypothetical protein